MEVGGGAARVRQEPFSFLDARARVAVLQQVCKLTFLGGRAKRAHS